MLDWDDLRVLNAVVMHRGLTQAALSEGMSEAQVRRRLRRLQRDVGFDLFHQTVSGLTLTPSGRRLFAVTSMMASDVALHAPHFDPRDDMPLVRFAVGFQFPESLIAGAVAALSKEQPDLRIEWTIVRGSWRQVLAQSDLAVLVDPPAEDEADAHAVSGARLGVFAHRDLVARFGRPARLQDLPRLGLIGAQTDALNRLVYGAFGLQPRPQDYRLLTDRLSAVVAAVRAGIGAGVVLTGLLEGEPQIEHLFSDVSTPVNAWIRVAADAPAASPARRIARRLADLLRTAFTAPSLAEV